MGYRIWAFLLTNQFKIISLKFFAASSMRLRDVASICSSYVGVQIWERIVCKKDWSTESWVRHQSDVCVHYSVEWTWYLRISESDIVTVQLQCRLKCNTRIALKLSNQQKGLGSVLHEARILSCQFVTAECPDKLLSGYPPPDSKSKTSKGGSRKTRIVYVM